MLDLGIIVTVFVYSLCKIISIAQKNNIDIYRCYIFMHFASIILLTLTWTTAFYYYARQQSICKGNCDDPSTNWTNLDNCDKIDVHHLLEWKAISDMIPTEFCLDLIVSYLIL